MMTIVYVFVGLVQPSAMALTAESVSQAQRGAAFGTILFFTSIGLTIGPLLGGILTTKYGYGSVLLASAAAFLVTGVARLAFLHETIAERSRRRLTIVPKLDLRLVAVLVPCALFNFSGGLTYPLYPLYAVERLGLSQELLGVMFSAGSLAGLLMTVPSGKVVDKIGSILTLTAGYAISMALNIPWIYSPSFVAVMFWWVGMSLFLQLASVAFRTLVAELSEGEALGQLMDFYGTAAGFSYALGPIIGGYLYKQTGQQVPFWLSGLLAIPVVASMRYAKSISSPRSKEHTPDNTVLKV